MFGMYEHVFVAVTISRMKRWVVELTNHWFICCSGLYMNHCPVTDKVSSSVRYFRQLRQTVRHTEKALSFKHVALKLTNNILPTQTASHDRLQLHLTSLCVFMWNLSFKHHYVPLSTSQSSATISCIIYNCFLFLFFHPAKPVTVQTAFRLTRMLTQGVFCSRVSSRCRLLCEPTEREKAACCLRSSLHEERSVMKKASSVNTWNKYANMTSLKCV